MPKASARTMKIARVRVRNTTVRPLHDTAMANADAMLFYRARGNDGAANRHGLAALEGEMAATALAFHRQTSVATRVILLRSVAALATGLAESLSVGG